MQRKSVELVIARVRRARTERVRIAGRVGVEARVVGHHCGGRGRAVKADKPRHPTGGRVVDIK